MRGIDCRHRFVARGSNKKTVSGTFVAPPPSVDSAASLGGAAGTGLAAGQTVVEAESLAAEPQAEARVV